MKTLTAKFRIVTPMFMSGADQQKAELRAPSIKGALRFWWRALNWRRLIEETDHSVEEILPILAQQESELFGDANTAGSSKVWLSLDKVITGSLSGDSLLSKDNHRKYLGYGLFTMGDNRERKAIPAKKSFTLNMLENPDLSDSQQQQLENSVKLMGLVGGLGARSRNGFGSIALEELNEADQKIQSRQGYIDAVTRLISTDRHRDSDPPFTAIGANIRLIVGPLKGSQEQAHRYLGHQYKDFRTRHKNDSRKQYFGLPLPGPRYDEDNRRASPLFFHIHPIGQQFAPVLLFIPAIFHPKHSNYDYSLVHQFLDQMEEAAQ